MYLNIDAVIAKEVYKKPSKRSTILERVYVLDPAINTKYVVAYRNRETGLALLGIRGTDPSKPRDLITDLRMGIGQDLTKMKRFTDVEKEYYKFLNKYPHRNRIVGHSLGSNITQELARKDKYNIGMTDYVLFNKAHTPYMRNELENEYIKAYRIEKDPVSILTTKGRTIKARRDDDTLLDRHGVEQFIGRGRY
tara:strand:+ start:312 stop:893 length:582 start_codon:yes stop_codon:yes gene_type:complete